MSTDHDDLDQHPEALVTRDEDGDVWVWRATGEPLTFDECEALGFDGTGRRD